MPKAGKRLQAQVEVQEAPRICEQRLGPASSPLASLRGSIHLWHRLLSPCLGPRTPSSVGSYHPDHPKEAGTAPPARSPGAFTPELQNLPRWLSEGASLSDTLRQPGNYMLASLQEEGAPSPTGARASRLVMAFEGDTLTPPMPPTASPLPGLLLQVPWGVCGVLHNCFYLFLRKNLGVCSHVRTGHGQNCKGREVRLQGPTHHRLSISPHPFSPALH